MGGQGVTYSYKQDEIYMKLDQIQKVRKLEYKDYLLR